MNSQPIAFFLSELHGGGAQRVIVNLANEFARRGLIVHLVLAKAEGPYLTKVSDKVRIINLKATKLIKSFFPLINYLNEYQPQWLISALSGANLLAIAAKYIAKANVKIMITIHNDGVQEIKNNTKKNRKIIPLLRRYFYPQADSIVTVSQGAANNLAASINISLERIKFIYNPVVTSEIKTMALAPLVNTKLANIEVPIILGVGRLNQVKDFANLIKAFTIIREKKPAYLIILGEGEERYSLEALVKDLDLESDVLLPGFVDNPYTYMAIANLFVLSSLSEGFGNVLVEAMACGTTVVSTDCPSGPREILAEGKYGKLVPVGDSVALAGAIIESLENPLNSDILRSRAEEFTVEKIADRYLQLIKNPG